MTVPFTIRVCPVCHEQLSSYYDEDGAWEAEAHWHGDWGRVEPIELRGAVDGPGPPRVEPGGTPWRLSSYVVAQVRPSYATAAFAWHRGAPERVWGRIYDQWDWCWPVPRARAARSLIERTFWDELDALGATLRRDANRQVYCGRTFTVPLKRHNGAPLRWGWWSS
jgi:hypothetical protein